METWAFVINVGLLKYAAASVIMATSVSACTTDEILPSEHQVQPEHEIYEEWELEVMGIVFHTADTLISENENENIIVEDISEDEYFRE